MLVVALSSCTAEPPSNRGRRPQGIQSRLRFLARQEAAAPLPAAAAPEEQATATASAPYPPAGVTPEIPFDLPPKTETPEQPKQAYGPPDTTYGPPPAEEQDDEPAPTYLPPDSTYGPPADAEGTTAQEADDLMTANLGTPRSKLSGRLRSAPVRRRRTQIVEVIRSEPAFTLTLQ